MHSYIKTDYRSDKMEGALLQQSQAQNSCSIDCSTGWARRFHGLLPMVATLILFSHSSCGCLEKLEPERFSVHNESYLCLLRWIICTFGICKFTFANLDWHYLLLHCRSKLPKIKGKYFFLLIVPMTKSLSNPSENCEAVARQSIIPWSISFNRN